MSVIQVEVPQQARLAEPLLRPKMPELDVIRGIASLAVLFYHGLYYARDFTGFSTVQRRVLFGFSPGQFGVNLFFVLSGFLITGLLIDSRRRPDYYRRFYIRRALRILPVYYAILAILFFAHAISNSFLALSVIYCANMSLIFGVVMSYPILWSLAVEEHFYLFWPAAVHRLTVRGLACVAAGIAIVSPLLRFACAMQAQHHDLLQSGCFFYTWNNADGLAWGALLAIAVREFFQSRRSVLRLSIVLISFAVLMSLIGAPFGILTRQTVLGSALQQVPWNIGFTGVIGLSLLAGASRWKAFVAPRILVFFGSISYGLYIVHQLVFSLYNRFAPNVLPQPWAVPNSWLGLWLRFAIAGAIATAIAFLSRRYFEEPFLRLKDKVT